MKVRTSLVRFALPRLGANPGSDIGNQTISRKIQVAFEEPKHLSSRELHVSGERIGRLMGRRPNSGCH